MPTPSSSPPLHEFTLIVAGADLDLDSDVVADALFEAGCDDALLSQENGTQSVDFAREAPSLHQAVLSAIADVESVDGLQVTRVVEVDLLSIAAIAERVGRTRESVRLYARGKRGPGGFPLPVNRHEDGRYHLWRWSEVLAWLDHHSIGDLSPPVHEAATLAAINAALSLRSLAPEVEPAARAQLRRLVDQGLAA